MNTTTRPVSAKILDAAIAWQLHLGDGEPTEPQREALQHWLSEHPEHARAWAQLSGIDCQLSLIDSPAARGALAQAAGTRQRRTRTRTATGLAVFCAVAIGITLRTQPMSVWLADEHTGAGEQRSLILADSSHIQLNSRSAVDIRFDDAQRRLYLHRGEVLVETAPGSDPRPFVVETEQGDLRALGTRFLVSREANATRLTVLKSAVAAHPVAAAQGQTVHAGEQILMYKGRLGNSLQAPIAADAWSHGMLVVDNMPLSDLLAKLDEYRPGYLGLDASLEHLRISGSFPLRDTDRALAALPASLPVRIEQRTQWWTKVVPATADAVPSK